MPKRKLLETVVPVTGTVEERVYNLLKRKQTDLEEAQAVVKGLQREIGELEFIVGGSSNGVKATVERLQKHSRKWDPNDVEIILAHFRPQPVKITDAARALADKVDRKPEAVLARIKQMIKDGDLKRRGKIGHGPKAAIVAGVSE